MCYGQLFGIVGLMVFLAKNIKQLYKEKKIALTKAYNDPLTGVFNRNILDKMLFDTSDCVCLIDLDNLKIVNDRFGHFDGDVMLKQFVAVTKTYLRQEDIIIRFGGDEFLLVIKNCSSKQTKIIIKRIKNEFKEVSYLKMGSFSFGVTKHSGNIDDDILIADTLMYDMKKNKPIPDII